MDILGSIIAGFIIIFVVMVSIMYVFTNPLIVLGLVACVCLGFVGWRVGR